MSIVDLIEYICSGQCDMSMSPFSTDLVPSVARLIASKTHAAAVDLEGRVHVGAEGHVVLDADEAVRETRRPAILGGGLGDSHVDVPRDDAPRRAAVVVGELAPMARGRTSASSSIGAVPPDPRLKSGKLWRPSGVCSTYIFQSDISIESMTT